MNYTVGLWIGIAFTAMMAILFGALLYSEQEILQQRQQEIRSFTAENFTNLSLKQREFSNEKVLNLVKRIKALQENVAEVRDTKIPQINNSITQTKKEIEAEIAKRKRNLAALEESLRSEAQKNKLITEIREDREAGRGSRDVQILKDRDEFKESYLATVKQVEKIRGENVTLMETHPAMIVDAQTGLSQLRARNEDLRIAIQNKEAALRRIANEVGNEVYDGEIISVDPLTKYVVINLGQVDHVHQGMQFDILRFRFNQWVRMGSLQIRRVDMTTSVCFLLDKTSVKRVCDLCGYTTNDPDSRYCPYCATGDDQNIVVPLNIISRHKDFKQDDLDPIQAGDKVTNPLYSKSKVLRFAIAGEPIIYSVAELREILTEYGAVVQDEVAVDTDYILLGRKLEKKISEGSPDAKARYEHFKAAMDMAERYGIPIMREADVNTFINH